MNDAETPRILLVDDDTNLLELMSGALTRSGLYETRTENRSARALATARDFQPHLILLDVDMPGLDGGEVARAIKADPMVGRTPIIFCTSLLPMHEGGSGVNIRGGEAFLSKPLAGTALLAAVASQLDAQAAAA